MMFLSSSTDPFINLAIENMLLSQIKTNDKILFLYKNKPCVVLGRFQNPWVETRLDEMLKDKVQLVRRQSGGGTVYHDLGNLNYSFIMGTRDHQKDKNMKILSNALNKLNVNAIVSDRADIKIDFNGIKKISGSAFKQKKDRSIHHGTMLIDSDLDKLNFYLQSDLQDLEAVGVKSVRSKVANLSEFDPGINQERYIDCLKASFEEEQEDSFQIENLEGSIKDLEHFDKITKWEWIFGETPKFNFEKKVSGMEITIESRKGIIEDISLNADFSMPYEMAGLAQILVGKRLNSETLIEVKESYIKNYGLISDEVMMSLKKSLLFPGL